MKNSENKTLNKHLIISFGLFGLTALIFQVVFAKNLVLLFGLTAPAIATVLAVYFSGLALGSILIGRIVDKFQHLVHRIYIFLFLLTGLYGILFPLIFPGLNKVILAIDQIYPLHFAGFNFFAFLLSFLFLIFPAVLIGGGFATVNKLFIRQKEKLGSGVSLVYFVETFGNVIGALLAGFVLIPALGNNATIISAATLNLIVAGFLFFLFKSSISFASEASKFREQSEQISLPQGASIQHPIFIYVLFLTGFLALALEVLYTKTLILFIGSSTYAFSLILIIFLLGIAFGSWVVSLFIDRIRRGYAYFGLFLGLIGFWLFLTIKFFEQLPFWYLKIFQTFETAGLFARASDFSVIFSTQLVLTFFVIFPATFLMGIVFPFGIRLANPAFGKLGQGIGKLYFSNTIGGVLGSLVAGFFLLPTFGFQITLLFILLFYFLLGIFFILKEKLLDMVIKVPLAVFLIFWGVFAITAHAWSPKILSSGVSVYAPDYLSFVEEASIQELKKGMLGDELLFYKEGLSQVAVIKRGADVFLRVNGKTDASNSLRDLEHEILTGAMPLMLHPAPKDILMIGLGSGISLGSVTQFDEPEKIEMVEIDPAVIEAATYFKNDNHNALEDPRVKTILADGRNYMLLNDKKYDIISSQPSNLWVSGNAYLFTKEFYTLAKSRLKEDGLIFQWIQLYALSSEDLKATLKTFSEVFPQFYVFNNVNNTDLFLIGALNEETILNFSQIEKKFQNEKIQQELSRIYIYDPYELLSYFVATGKEAKEFINNINTHSDNRPFLEFSAPKTIYQTVDERSSEIILKLREKTFQKYPEIIQDLDDKSKEEFRNYLLFRQKIIPVVLALRTGDLDKALEFYKEAQKTKVFNMIIYKRLLNACHIMAEIVNQQQGKEASEKELSKCEFIFFEETETE